MLGMKEKITCKYIKMCVIFVISIFFNLKIWCIDIPYSVDTFTKYEDKSSRISAKLKKNINSMYLKLTPVWGSERKHWSKSNSLNCEQAGKTKVSLV